MLSFSYAKFTNHYMRNIAQMVERRILNPEGVGSNPTVSLFSCAKITSHYMETQRYSIPDSTNSLFEV